MTLVSRQPDARVDKCVKGLGLVSASTTLREEGEDWFRCVG